MSGCCCMASGINIYLFSGYLINLFWISRVIISDIQNRHVFWTSKRRKLNYRKDDRAMRPILYGCMPWKFSRVPDTPTVTFPEIFNGLLFRSILWMCAQNLKFLALPVPEIIGGTKKNWAVPGYAHAPLSLKFLMGFCSDWARECSCQIWSSQL